MKKKIAMFFLASGIFAGSFLVSNAQEKTDLTKLTPEQVKELQNASPQILPPVAIEGAANCFDYYKFGSVQVDVEAEIASPLPGLPLTLKGKIKNENNYPVVDGRVYVKVFRKQADQDKAHANGNHLVDQFIAKDGISLNSKEEKDIVFDWNVPNYAVGGEYQLATFFVSAKKFNLLGLTFTDDIVGNIFNFSVKSQNKETVEFDKNSVKINDQDYHFAAFPPRIEKDKEVSVKANISNTTKTDQTVPVTYTLYSWDSQSEENKVETKEEKVLLKPGESKELAYMTKENKSPVYYLVIKSEYKDSKSILGARFIRTGVNEVRLNFPAVTSYPLKKDQQTTLFSCLHNSGEAGSVAGNKMILTLLDEDGKDINKYEYSGSVSGAMMAMKDDFVPEKDYENFELKAELYTDGKLVDSAEMKYECSQIDPSLCKEKPKAVVAPVELNEKSGSSPIMIMIISLIVILGVLVAVIIIRKRRFDQHI